MNPVLRRRIWCVLLATIVLLGATGGRAAGTDGIVLSLRIAGARKDQGKVSLYKSLARQSRRKGPAAGGGNAPRGNPPVPIFRSPSTGRLPWGCPRGGS